MPVEDDIARWKWACRFAYLHDQVAPAIPDGMLEDVLEDTNFNVDEHPYYDGVLVLGDWVATTPERLLSVSPEDRVRLLRIAENHLSDQAQADMVHLTLSANGRWRFPQHMDETVEFFGGDDMDPALRLLWDNAPPKQRYRAYDLANGYRRAIEGAPNRNDQAIAFGTLADPADLDEFVECYQYLHAWADAEVATLTDVMIREARRPLPPLPPLPLLPELTRAQRRAMRTLARDAIDARLGGANPDQQAMEDALTDFEALKTAVGVVWGVGAIASGAQPTDTDRHRFNRVRLLAPHLRLVRTSAAAYHAQKHPDIILPVDRVDRVEGETYSLVASYRNAAIRITGASPAGGEASPGQLGGEKYFFVYGGRRTIASSSGDLAYVLMDTCF